MRSDSVERSEQKIHGFLADDTSGYLNYFLGLIVMSFVLVRQK